MKGIFLSRYKMELIKLEPTILSILQEYPMARKSDNYLILAVCKKLGIDTSLSFEQIMLNKNRPSLESIIRVRRKVCEKHPELKDLFVEELRWNKTGEFIQYAFWG